MKAVSTHGTAAGRGSLGPPGDPRGTGDHAQVGLPEAG